MALEQVRKTPHQPYFVNLIFSNLTACIGGGQGIAVLLENVRK